MTGEKESLFRTVTSAVQRRFTKAFELEENLELPDIPDAGQPVVRSEIEKLGRQLLQTVLTMPDIKDNIQPSSLSPKAPSILQNRL